MDGFQSFSTLAVVDLISEAFDSNKTEKSENYKNLLPNSFVENAFKAQFLDFIRPKFGHPQHFLASLNPSPVVHNVFNIQPIMTNSIDIQEFSNIKRFTTFSINILNQQFVTFFLK